MTMATHETPPTGRFTPTISITVEAYVAERRPEPWPDQYRTDIPAKALYERYRAWTEARGDKPLSQVDFGVALQAVPGITRVRIPAGHIYNGLTVETRQERAEDRVR